MSNNKFAKPLYNKAAEQYLASAASPDIVW